MKHLTTRLFGLGLASAVGIAVMAAPAVAAPPKRVAAPVLAAPSSPTGSTSQTFSWTSADVDTFTCSVDGAKALACGSGTSGSFPTTVTVAPNSVTTHTFTVRAKLASGKSRTATSSLSWVIDVKAPQAPTVPPVTTPTSNTSESIEFSDADGSVDHFVCSVVDGSSNVIQAESTCTNPYPVTGPLASGTYTASVIAVDAAGNRSAPGQTTWTVDATAPSSPVFTQQPANPTHSTSATFAWTSDPDVVSSTCSLDGADPVGCVSPQTFTGLAAGTHTFVATDKDSLGNGNPSQVSWLIDLTPPPAPDFVSGPSTTTDQTSASFSFSDKDATATFLCSLDGSAFSACTTPKTYPSLLDGDHHFQVKAVDAAGNASGASPYDWTIDTSSTTATPLSPVAFIDGPAAYVNTAGASFKWIALDDTTTGFRCSLDGAAFTATGCNGPDANLNGTSSATVSAEGLHVFAVKATDGTNLSPATTWSWTYDHTPPSAPTFSTTPAKTSNTRSALFSFASEANAQFLCSLDGVPATLCASPVTLVGLADGSHTFTVTARDAAGNTRQSSYTWTVDLSAPAAPTVTGPTGYVKSNAANITFSDAGSTFTCSLDGATATACTSPKALTGLIDGAHTFAVTATNSSAKTATAQISWVVDTVKPVLHVSNVPAEGSTTSPRTIAPSISQTETNAGDIVCALSGPVSSGTCGPYSGLTDGSYTLTVNTTDLAGNAAAPFVRHWTVKTPAGSPGDTTPPTATIAATKTLTGPSTVTFSEAVHSLTVTGAALVVTGTSTAVPSKGVCLSGSTAVACGGTFTSFKLTPKAALVPGQHYTVRLLAGAVKDAAGNPLVAKSLNFRASRAEQETTPAAKKLWANVKNKAAYGGSFVRENTKGTSASYTFTGTNVTWWTVKGRNQGKATVYIDGVRKAIVNDYATSTRFKVAHKYAKLANKRHTIRIVVNGVKGATAGTGTFVSVDAVSVGTKRVNTPALKATWRSLALKQFSGGHAIAAKLRGDALTFVFRGTAVTWVTEKARNQGKVAVYVDGVRKATIDNYATTTKFGVKRGLGGLTDKVHTLKLVVLGTHHTGGTGTWVTVDRFLVT